MNISDRGRIQAERRETIRDHLTWMRMMKVLWRGGVIDWHGVLLRVSKHCCAIRVATNKIVFNVGNKKL